MSSALAGYRLAAHQLKAAYDALDPVQIYKPVQDVMPKPGEHVLDIGAGTGRDAAWWQAAGCHVTAVEPVTDLWAHPAIPVVQDELPDLPKLVERNLTFDVIILTGIWHHLSPKQRKSAIPVLKSQLKPAGRLVFNLRHGPCPSDRPGYACNPSFEAKNLVTHGFEMHFQRYSESIQHENSKRKVTWTWIAADYPRV